MASQKKKRKKTETLPGATPPLRETREKKVERRFVWFTITDWYSDHICW